MRHPNACMCMTCRVRRIFSMRDPFAPIRRPPTDGWEVPPPREGPAVVRRGFTRWASWGRA